MISQRVPNAPPVAGAEVTHDGAQLGQIGLRLIRRAHVRLGHDFHQRNARTVQVHEGHGRVLVVHGLAGILLQMQALDADFDILEIALTIWTERNGDGAFTDDRVLELRNLVALRQIRIEVVLAVEDRTVVDLRLQTETGANRLPDAFLVDDGQHAGHGRINQRHVGVRRIAEGRGRAGEKLGIGQNLRMHLHADDDLPIAGGAGDKAFRVWGAHVYKGHLKLTEYVFLCVG